MGGKAWFAVIVGSIASVAAVTVSSAGPVGAQTAAETNVAPALDWKPCGRDFPGALCATAKVPLDYGDPQGPSTSIALAKIPASNKRGKRGSVFVNPGGPGGSGVEFVLTGFGEFLAGNLRGRFDIVGFDPRGVGASDPLRCFKSQRALDRYFANVPFFPYEQPQFRPFFDTYDALGPKCLAQRSAVAAHMNTADVARDLDLLRAAVGDAQLTYLGFSYGSFLGTTYANLFPDRVRALVIDGVLNPELWSSGQQIRSDRVATQQEFEEFLRLCDEAGPDCDFSERGGSTKQWEELAEAVRRRPIALPDGTIYTYDFLIGDATGAMYAPEVWPLAAELLDALEDAALGDQDAADRAVSARIALWARLTPPGADAELPEWPRRLLRQPMRGHRVSVHVRGVPVHRSVRRGRLTLRSLLVVVQQWLLELAGEPGPVHRTVDGHDFSARASGRQLLRRHHRLCRRAGRQRLPRRQQTPQLRGLGPHRVRPQRVRDGLHRRVPPQRVAAA